MATNAEIAAKLLRDAATFFRHVGEQNDPIKDQMDSNAKPMIRSPSWSKPNLPPSST